MSLLSYLNESPDNPSRPSTQIRQWRITQLAIAVYMFSAVALPAPLLYVSNVPIYTIDLISILVILLSIITNKWRVWAPDKRVISLFAIFLVGAFVALFQGLILSGFSILFIYTIIRLLINIFAPITLMWLITTREGLQTAVSGMTLGMIAVAILGILQVVPNDLIEPFLHTYYPGQTRADGYVHYRISIMDNENINKYAFATWYTANPYAAVLAMTILFPFILLLRIGRTSQITISWQSYYIFAFILGSIAFIFAETRAPVFALGPILAYTIWWQMDYRQILISSVVGGACLLLLESLSIGPTPTTFLADILTLFLEPIPQQRGLVVRIQSHEAFFSFVLTHPIQTAIGFGPDINGIANRGVGGPVILAAGNALPLNSVLGYVLNYGLLGTAAYFGIVVYAIRSGVQRLGELKFETVSDLSVEESVLYAATAALTVGLFLHPLDSYWAKGGFEVRHVFWSILTIQQSALHLSRESDSNE